MWIRYFLVLLCFLLDGVLALLFPIQFGVSEIYFIPCIGFSALILTIRKLDLTDSLIISAIFGMFYDAFYANTTFQYLIIFIITCFIVRIWIKQINQSLIENVLLCISTIFIKELMVYFYMIWSNQSSMEFSVWLSNRMFLTLLVNALLVLAIVFISYVTEDYLQQKELKLRREERLPWMK